MRTRTRRRRGDEEEEVEEADEVERSLADVLAESSASMTLSLISIL